jgi:hypothetical protein
VYFESNRFQGKHIKKSENFGQMSGYKDVSAVGSSDIVWPRLGDLVKFKFSVVGSTLFGQDLARKAR